jgi:hypothetical protein
MLNSDDPTMFQTDLGEECAGFCGRNDLSSGVVRPPVLNGVDARWLDVTDTTPTGRR